MLDFKYGWQKNVQKKQSVFDYYAKKSNSICSLIYFFDKMEKDIDAYCPP